jgi:hypothetical protein
MPLLLLLAFLSALTPSLAFGAAFGPSQPVTSGKILRGRFVHEHPVKGVDKPIRTEGRFVVAPDYGMIWAVERPLPVTFIFTSSGMAQMIGDFPLLIQSSQKKPFLAQVQTQLVAALSGNWTTLEPDFSMSHEGTPERWNVKITPRATAKGVPFTTLTASGGTLVERADVLRPDGLSDTFLFQNQSLTPAPPSAAETRAFSILRP